MSEVLTKAERIRRAMDRVEEAATEVLYQGEHWTLTGRSFHDVKIQRRNLLGAARRYGRAMDALTRIRT